MAFYVQAFLSTALCVVLVRGSTLNCTSTIYEAGISPAVCIDVVDVCDNIVIVYAMLACGVLKGDCERVANEKSHEDYIILRYNILFYLHFSALSY